MTTVIQSRPQHPLTTGTESGSKPIPRSSSSSTSTAGTSASSTRRKSSSSKQPRQRLRLSSRSEVVVSPKKQPNSNGSGVVAATSSSSAPTTNKVLLTSTLAPPELQQEETKVAKAIEVGIENSKAAQLTPKTAATDVDTTASIAEVAEASAIFEVVTLFNDSTISGMTGIASSAPGSVVSASDNEDEDDDSSSGESSASASSETGNGDKDEEEESSSGEEEEEEDEYEDGSDDYCSDDDPYVEIQSFVSGETPSVYYDGEASYFLQDEDDDYQADYQQDNSESYYSVDESLEGIASFFGDSYRTNATTFTNTDNDKDQNDEQYDDNYDHSDSYYSTGSLDDAVSFYDASVCVQPTQGQQSPPSSPEQQQESGNNKGINVSSVVPVIKFTTDQAQPAASAVTAAPPSPTGSDKDRRSGVKRFLAGSIFENHFVAQPVIRQSQTLQQKEQKINKNSQRSISRAKVAFPKIPTPKPTIEPKPIITPPPGAPVAEPPVVAVEEEKEEEKPLEVQVTPQKKIKKLKKKKPKKQSPYFDAKRNVTIVEQPITIMETKTWSEAGPCLPGARFRSATRQSRSYRPSELEAKSNQEGSKCHKAQRASLDEPTREKRHELRLDANGNKIKQKIPVVRTFTKTRMRTKIVRLEVPVENPLLEEAEEEAEE